MGTKIASEIFKMVVGTDKGIEKFERGSEVVWVIELGLIRATLKDELKYDLFGNRVEGDYWNIDISMAYGEDVRLYIDKKTLKINEDYAYQKFEERKESWTKEYKEAIGM